MKHLKYAIRMERFFGVYEYVGQYSSLKEAQDAIISLKQSASKETVFTLVTL